MRLQNLQALIAVIKVSSLPMNIGYGTIILCLSLMIAIRVVVNKTYNNITINNKYSNI